jgi:hypothetical protein
MSGSGKRVTMLVVALAALTLLAGCRESMQPPTPTILPVGGAAESAVVEVRVDPTPSTVGEAALVVMVTDAAGETPVTGLTVNASGDMEHAGMNRVIADGVETEPGVYTIPWNWTMGGEWFVAVHVYWPDGTEQVTALTVQVEA